MNSRYPMRALPGFLLVFSLSALFLFPGPLRGQAAGPDPSPYHFNLKYLGKAGSDLGRVLISPIHWKGKDLILFGGTVAATGLIMVVLDEEVKETVLNHETTGEKDFSLLATHLGEGPFLIGLSAVLYGSGEVFGNEGLRRAGLLSLESFGIAAVITTGLKVIAGRHRPSTEHDYYDFHFFSSLNHEHSFPSGHASSAFAVASVIAGVSDSFWVGAASYGLATLVAVSRVANNEHWLSDVFLGSIIGYFVGKEVLALNRPSGVGRPTLGLGTAPGGLSVSLRF
jgi:membrane-associated phospholipid phosphatase